MSVRSEHSESDAEAGADNDDGRDEYDAVTVTVEVEEDVDINDDVSVEGDHIDRTLNSPSFQMRVFNPGSTEYPNSNEYSAEAIEHAVEDWSERVQELPSITEDESAAARAVDHFPTDVKRRCSDTVMQLSQPPSGCDIRRVSTMSDYQRLKGRHKSPKLVAFKASPAGPALATMSVQPPGTWHVSSMDDRTSDTLYDSDVLPRRTSQAIQSDFGISQLLWDEPSSSSDSDITVLTGSAVDYLAANEIEEQNPSSSPMERLKTILKAWSWEKDLSDGSPDNQSRFAPLPDTKERGQRRHSSDFLENPPGPPNTVRHSGQSSIINSEPQTPVDEGNFEDGEDDNIIELRTKSLTRPIPIPASNSSTTSSGDYLAIPRRTNSLPSASSSIDREESCFHHRDSVDISHARMECDETKDKRNQELIINSRDSFVITKSRFNAKHPKAGRSMIPTRGGIAWSQFGGLSPIADASPPSGPLRETGKGKQKAVKVVETRKHHSDEHEVRPERHSGGGAAKKAVGAVEVRHTEEHTDCPICELDRPRWFEANYREW